MEEKEISEGNKLIREFMEHGGKAVKYNYHSSWTCLMLVVEKIESIKDDVYGRFAVHIYSNVCCIQSTKTDPFHKLPLYMSDPNAILNSKIESTYYNVVSFIKWHNS